MWGCRVCLSVYLRLPVCLSVCVCGLLLYGSDVLAVREIARQLYLLDDVNAEHEFAHELKQVACV